MKKGGRVQNTDRASDLYPSLGAAPTKTEAQRRKDQPVYEGFVAYFPDAMNAVAEVSRVGNEQHNLGQPLHWAYGKSMDHKSSCIRHLEDSGDVDTDGLLHDAKAAWRAMANLQTALENKDPMLHARRQAQRDAAARGER